MLTFRERVTLQTAKFVKNGGLFVLCFICAFWLSRYGMPLHSMTTHIIEYSQQIFGKYQADIYEAGTDPITFTSLIATILLYALIIFGVAKIIIRKIKR